MDMIFRQWPNISKWLIVLCALVGELFLLRTYTPANVFFDAPQVAIRAVFPYIGEIEYENADTNGRAFRWLPSVGDIRLVGGMLAPAILDVHAHTGRPEGITTQLTISQGSRRVVETELVPGWRHLKLLIPVSTWHDGYATVQYEVTGRITDDRRLLGLAVDHVQLRSTLLSRNVVAQWSYWVVLVIGGVLLTYRHAGWWRVVIGVVVLSWMVQWYWPGTWSQYVPTLWGGAAWLVVACLLLSGILRQRAVWSLPIAIGMTVVALLALRSDMPWLGAIGMLLVWSGYRDDSTAQPALLLQGWGRTLLVAATVVAIVLRVLFLDQLPQGMFRDEARHGGLAQLIIEGSRMVYSPFANLPAGYFYLSAFPIQWFGASAFAIRISAAVLGSMTIPLAYWAFYLWWGTTHALLTSIVLSTLLWHVGLSRIGFPASAGPWLTLVAVGMLWRACAVPTQRRALIYAIIAGCATGAMTLGYHSTRLMPLVVLGMIVLAWYTARWSVRSRIVVLVLWAATTLVTAFPILWYAVTESYNYMKRIDSTSITGLAQQEGIPALVAVIRNIVAYLGALMIAGDGNARHFYMGMPQLNVSEGVAFLAGVVALWRQRSAKVAWLYWYLLIAVLPGLLSVDAPHALRTVEATIPVALIVASGASVLIGAVQQRWQVHFIGVALVLTGLWSGATYYQWQRDARAYAEFDGQITQAVTYVQQHQHVAQLHQAQWYLPKKWRDGDVGVYLLRGMSVGSIDAGTLEGSTASTLLILLPHDAPHPTNAQQVAVPTSLQTHGDLALWCVGACSDVQWIR